MERKGNEKDNIVKVIMPKTPYRRQKMQARPLKITLFCYTVQPLCIKHCIQARYTNNKILNSKLNAYSTDSYKI